MSEHLAVIIPTIAGREADHARCRVAYRHTCPAARVFTVYGEATCGEAWNKGARLAADWFAENRRTLRYLHFSADDLIPQVGWHLQALLFAERGDLPSPVLLDREGAVWNPQEPPGSDAAFPRVPLLNVERWQELGPVPPIHYYSDVWLGRRGIPCPVVGSYRFVHSWAQPGRIHDSEPDRVAYEAALTAEAL